MKNPLSFLTKENKTLLSSYNAGLLQGKAYRVLSDHVSTTLQPFDLSITEWKILGQLYDKEKLQLNEIAKILEVEPPLITKLVARMETKDLVSRTANLDDKRVKIVEISKQGKKLIPEIEKKVKQSLKNLLKGVNLHDLVIYAKVLKAIAANN